MPEAADSLAAISTLPRTPVLPPFLTQVEECSQSALVPFARSHTLAQPLGLGGDFAVEFMEFGIFRLKDAVPPFLKPYEPGIELAHPAAVEPGRRP